VADRFELLRRLTVALARRAEGGRLVVDVDDAQLLDVAPVALTYELAASRRAFVLVSGAVR
jgi:hypothetical protein